MKAYNMYQNMLLRESPVNSELYTEITVGDTHTKI